MAEDIKTQALKELTSIIQEGHQFALEQLPKACQDIVTMGKIQAAVAMGGGLCLVLLSLLGLTYIRRRIDDEFGSVLVAVFSTIGLLIGLLIVFINLYWFFVAMYAPRAYHSTAS